MADGSTTGFRKKMRQIWIDRGNPRNTTEQTLASQVLEIKKKNLLTSGEREQAARDVQNINDTTEEDHPENRENIQTEPQVDAGIDDYTDGALPQTGIPRGVGQATVIERNLGLHEPSELEGEERLPGRPMTTINDDTENDEILQPTRDLPITNASNLTAEEERTTQEIKDKLELFKGKEVLEPIPSLKKYNQHKLKTTVTEINNCLDYIETNNISETNTLLYSAATLIAERMNVKRYSSNNNSNKRPRKDQPWLFRLKKKQELLRKHLSWITEWKRGNLQDHDKKRGLQNKYKTHLRGLIPTEEMLKQRLQACTGKLKRFQDRIKGYHQNNLFKNNQRKLYSELKGASTEQDAPDPGSSIAFWSNIWSIEVEHEKNTEWINKTKQRHNNITRDADFQVNLEILKKQIKKVPNWKAPGPDQAQGYYLKNFTNLHRRIADQLQNWVRIGQVPEWLTLGRTVLIQKDKGKGNISSNYRPITCLPLMWKLLTGMMNEKIHDHLDANNLIPKEQKGGRRKCKGTKDHLLVDKMIMKNAKSQRKSLSMGFIDYRKAFDIIPHLWLIQCMEIYGIASNIITLIKNSMNNWRVELTANNKKLGEVKINRGIFQGDALSPLLFILALIPLSEILNDEKSGYAINKRVRVNHLLFMDDLKLYGKNERELETLIRITHQVSSDIKMAFGIDKCGTIHMVGGEVTHSQEIDINPDEAIKEIDEGGYKYLGVLEYNNILHAEMKKIKGEYLKRVRLILRTQLSSKNSITAINTWAVLVVRYAAAVIDWTILEKQKLDNKTRKLLNVHRSLHSRSCIDCLYLKRDVGGRRLLSVEESIDSECRPLGKYVKAHHDVVMREVWLTGTLKKAEDSEQYKRQKIEERKKGWHDKQMAGQYLRQVENIQAKESWNWLKYGDLKRETEGTILAAQEQALRTRSIQRRIEHRIEVDPKCRLCGQKDETINHIISECSKLAQKEYKRRHDKVAKAVHWTICKKYDLQATGKWYQHIPETVQENDLIKLLWDYNIQTDQEIEARRPDLVLKDKNKNITYLIDVAIPYDTRIKEKQVEKILKYQDLKIQIQRCWETRVKVIPIIIGALGAQPLELKKYLEEIGCQKLYIGTIQKSVLLGTANVIRKVLGE